jgi:hypothetical protein
MSTTQPNETEQKIPTKEELMAFFSEQIEVKKLQVELQELNTSLAMHRAEELKALAFISQITNPGKESEEQEEAPVRTLKKEKKDGNS